MPQRCAADDEIPPKLTLKEPSESVEDCNDKSTASYAITSACNDAPDRTEAEEDEPVCKSGKPLRLKWSTGAGPRIGCMREYPSSLQFQALEHVKLSPRSLGANDSLTCNGPIPSPRPSPRIHLSPRIAYMGRSGTQCTWFTRYSLGFGGSANLTRSGPREIHCRDQNRFRPNSGPKRYRITCWGTINTRGDALLYLFICIFPKISHCTGVPIV